MTMPRSMSTPRRSEFPPPFALLMCLTFLAGSFLTPVLVEGTTQVIENLNPGSAVTYTVAATDTLFRVKNVDTTGTNHHINIEFPTNGVMASGLVIEIEDCDVSSGALYFGRSESGTHKQAHFVGASITIRNNNAGTFSYMYAAGSGSDLTSTYSSSTTINIHNNGFQDLRLFDAWNGAINSATVQSGSTFSFHSSSTPGNYFRVAKSENGNADSHLIVDGTNSVFEIYGFTRTAATGLITIALAESSGSSKLEVRAGGAFKMYQNSVYQIEVGRGNAGSVGSTIEVKDAGSTLDLSSNTLSQTLTLCLAATCPFSDNAVVTVSQNTAADLMVVYAAAGTATMTITSSTLSVVGNTVASWLILGRAESNGQIAFTATESSLVEVSSNTADLLRIGRAMGTRSLSFTVSESSVIDCRGNHIPGANNLIMMQSSVTSTFSMTSSSRFNVVQNSVPSSQLAFFYLSGGSLTATLDTSSTIDISDNTMFEFRFALTSSTSSLALTTSKSSAVEVQSNTITGTKCYFGQTSSGNSAIMNLNTASLFQFENNNAASTTCTYCAGSGTCTINLQSSAQRLGPS